MVGDCLPPLKNRVKVLAQRGGEVVPTKSKFDHIPNPHIESSFEEEVSRRLRCLMWTTWPWELVDEKIVLDNKIIKYNFEGFCANKVDVASVKSIMRAGRTWVGHAVNHLSTSKIRFRCVFSDL